MKIALYSDVHLKLDVGKQYVERLEELEQFYKYLEKNDVKKIFFLGDLFQRKYILEDVLIHYVSKFFASKNIETYFLVGNHDKGINDINLMSFLILKDIYHIIDEYQYVDIDNVRLHLLPWKREFPDLGMVEMSNSKKNFLLMHFYPRCVVEYDNIKYVISSSKKDSFDMNAVKDFDKVVTGHLHYPFIKDNLIVVGCLFPTSFAETFDTKFIVMDTETVTVENVSTSSVVDYPKYVTLDVKDVDINNIKESKNYYRIIYNDVKDIERIRSKVNIDRIQFVYEKVRRYDDNNELVSFDLDLLSLFKTFIDDKVEDSEKEKMIERFKDFEKRR